MTDRRRDDPDDFLDEEGPGSDPGAAYERAVDEEQVADDDERRRADEESRPGVEDVFRSGS